MTYVENIFICLAIPMILSLFFTKGHTRFFTIFVIIGMGICMLSAYVSSFFMGYCGADMVETAIEITPVCEEVMKLLPLLFFILIFEPEAKDVSAVALAIAVGFATLENVCYLTENGAENLSFLLIRGISAGALHILCGIASGFGMTYVFCRRWLALTGTMGILGTCVGFHATYNLLITTEGGFREIGYLFPSLLIICLFVIRQMLPKLRKLIFLGFE